MIVWSLNLNTMASALLHSKCALVAGTFEEDNTRTVATCLLCYEF